MRLPAPGGVAGAPPADGGDCGAGVPLVGGAIDAVCDVGGWLGDRAGEAVDLGVGYLGAVTGLADSALDELRATVHATVANMRALSAALGSALAHTPAGQVALDVVEIGRRFGHTATAECSDDAPAADGTGGSAHRVMVVAGINSSGAAGDRGPTVALDVAALGYHAAEGEVRYFSYAADGGPYTAAATHGRIEVAAARLGEQLRAMQREQPGREVDLIAHSQGGVVVDWFLGHDYHAGDPTLPPLGNVVTLSSPHVGAPLATAARQIRTSPVGRAALDAVGGVSSLPPPSSPAVQELAEDSRLVGHLWAQGVPEHFDFTTIGATEDLVVPATRISVPGRDRDRRRGRQRQRAQRDRACPRRPEGRARRARRAPPAVCRSRHRAAQRGRAGRHQPARAHHRQRRRRGAGGSRMTAGARRPTHGGGPLHCSTTRASARDHTRPHSEVVRVRPGRQRAEEQPRSRSTGVPGAVAARTGIAVGCVNERDEPWQKQRPS